MGLELPRVSYPGRTLAWRGMHPSLDITIGFWTKAVALSVNSYFSFENKLSLWYLILVETKHYEQLMKEEKL